MNFKFFQNIFQIFFQHKELCYIISIIHNNKTKQQMQAIIKNIANFKAIVNNDWFIAYDDHLLAS